MAFQVQSDPANTFALTDEQVSFFKESGYIALDRVTTVEDTAEIRATLESLFQNKAGFDEGRQFNVVGTEGNSDEPSLPQILTPHKDAASLRETLFYRNAFAIAKQLIGPTAQFDLDHVIMKPPINGPETPRHQDEAYRKAHYDYTEVSFWMPLQPVDSVNGCMEFIPESHKDGILTHRSYNNDTRVHALECREGYDLADLVACPLPAGGCTIHTGRTVHGAGPNRSSEPRYAYVLIFQLPPVLRKTLRIFPWQEEKNTERMKRERDWMMRDGLLMALWRRFQETPVHDYKRLVFRALTKLRKKVAL